MNAYPRRRFLLSVLAACGTPLFKPAASAGMSRPAQSDSDFAQASRTALGYFGTTQSEAVRVIGEAYLQQMGIDNRRADILAAVRGTLDIIEAARTQRAATAALVNAVRRDFQDARVVHVHGWVLSRTEVELCAMTLLAAG